MRTEQEQLADLSKMVLGGLERIEKEQPEGPIVLHGKEGEILYDLCQLVCHGEPDFLKFAGVMLFKDRLVICQ